MKILIAYGTKYGSTRSIAERIQERILAAQVGEVVLAPFDDKLSVNEYDFLILGSCIHMQNWISPSKKFIKRNATILNKTPKSTWAFSVGMPPDKYLETEATMIEKWLKKSIPVRGHTLFQGVYRKEDLGGCFRLLFSCFGGKYEDLRKWHLMDEWADMIVREVRNEQQVGNLPL